MVLEILVSGLCAFVRQSCATGNAKAMNIVMMKGAEEHSPRLVVYSLNVVPPAKDESDELKNGRTLQEVVDLPDGRQYFVWDLTGYRLEIVGAPSIGIVEGGRNPDNSTASDDPHGRTDQPDDFSWIPEIHKTCGATVDKAKADPAFLDDTKLPAKALARMMTLTVDPTASAKNNWLEAQFLDPSTKPSVYEFGEYKYKQALADRARLTMRLNTPIKLRLVPYGKGLTKEIHLTAPAMGFGSDLISVSLSNMPKVQQPDSSEITHFHSYQDVLKENPKTCVNPKKQGEKSVPYTHIAPVKCVPCSSCGSE